MFLRQLRLLFIPTDEGHVHPVFRHMFVPSAPSLAFVGLLWKSVRFPQFELQASNLHVFFMVTGSFVLMSLPISSRMPYILPCGP